MVHRHFRSEIGYKEIWLQKTSVHRDAIFSHEITFNLADLYSDTTGDYVFHKRECIQKKASGTTPRTAIVHKTRQIQLSNCEKIMTLFDEDNDDDHHGDQAMGDRKSLKEILR